MTANAAIACHPGEPTSKPLAMHCSYADVTSRLGPPVLLGRQRSPTVRTVSPAAPDVYVEETALHLIACRGCETEFRVAVSRDRYDFTKMGTPEMTTKPWGLIGDIPRWSNPPHTDYCSAGRR